MCSEKDEELVPPQKNDVQNYNLRLRLLWWRPLAAVQRKDIYILQIAIKLYSSGWGWAEG